MSKLIVEVCKIEELLKHENADKLEIAKIKGWYCIVQKGSYQVNDKVIFIPPDSCLPAEMIEKYALTFLKNGNRVRALKLRGFVSQGLILPSEDSWPVGKDVAEELKITKWEPPASGITKRGQQLKKRHVNQNFSKYTDIDNIRHYNDLFVDGETVVINEKIHGSNWRSGYLKRTPRNGFWGIFDRIALYFAGEYEWVYGSHNVQLRAFTPKYDRFYKDNIYLKVANKYNIKKICPKDTIIYGEVYGQGVQDLNYGENQLSLVVFDVKVNDVYLSYEKLKEFCSERNLPMAPELYVGPYNQQLIAEYTKGDSILAQIHGAKQIREGIVIRPYSETTHPKIGRKILKSISEDYLLRNNGTENH